MMAIVDRLHGSRRGVAAALATAALLLVLAAGPDASAALFGPATGYPAGDGPTSVAIRDLDGNGRPDLITAGTDGISVLRGTGGGAFAAPVTYPAGGSLTSLAVKDFNGDHRADVVATRAGGVVILLGTGTGAFGAPIFHKAGNGRDPIAVAAGDISGDDRPDVVTAGPRGVFVLLGKGNGKLGDATQYDSMGASGAIAIGEFTGDHQPDLAATYRFPASPAQENASVAILPGTGGGAFGPQVGVYTIGFFLQHGLTVGDFNRDGLDDFAVGQTESIPFDPEAGGLSVVLSKGGGVFGGPIPVTTRPDYGWATALAVADFDGDGNADLAAVDGGSGDDDDAFYIVRGTATGAFDPHLAYEGLTGTTPYAVAAGDLNRDGRPDVVMANPGSDDVTVVLDTGLAEQPGIQLTQSIHYADRSVATTSPAETVTIRDTGDYPLVMPSIRLRGANPGQFKITDNACRGVLRHGEACNVRIAFAPTTPGAKTARLEVVDNAAGSPHRTELSGTAIAAPLLKLSRTFIDFGAHPTGTVTTKHGLVTVTNVGSAALHVFGPVVLGGHSPGQFRITDDTCADATVPPGGHCTFDTHFAPTALGRSQAFAGIVDDAQGHPHVMALEGDATSPLRFDPRATTFDDQPVGTTSAPRSITVTNVSDEEVAISSITQTFGSPDVFTIGTGDCLRTLDPDGSCTFTATFHPSSVQGYDALIAANSAVQGFLADGYFQGFGVP